MVSNFTGKDSFIPSYTWILDSRATHQICHNVECFESFEPTVVTSHVTLPTGQHAPIIRIGKVSFSPHFLLDKVMFVLTLSTILFLSVLLLRLLIAP